MNQYTSLKGFLTAHTLLTDLEAKLDQYQVSISEKGEGNATRLALKQASQNTPTHPIENNFPSISPYARSLIEIQISMCFNYDIIAEEDTVKSNLNHFRNRLHMRNENDLCQDIYNEASIYKTVLNHDLGIEDAFNLEKLRKTTLTTCTCLFTSSYGLPCRHMLWIYRQKQFEYIRSTYQCHRTLWLIAANIQVENQVWEIISTQMLENVAYQH